MRLRRQRVSERVANDHNALMRAKSFVSRKQIDVRAQGVDIRNAVWSVTYAINAAIGAYRSDLGANAGNVVGGADDV